MPTTFQNLISNSGFSGTDTSFLEIASGLAKMGNGVRVLSGGPEQTYIGADNIKYMSPHKHYLDSFDIRSDLNKVDVLVIVFFTQYGEVELVDLVRRLNCPALRVVLWCHCVWTKEQVLNIHKICARPVALVGVSDYVRIHMQACIGPQTPFFKIPNGINPDIFGDCETSLQRQSLSFVFSASYERGGRIAREVHALLDSRGLCMGSMYVCSYCNSQMLPSLSKHELAKKLQQSEYMVYPLTLDNACVHHDTFACVVLEAMACGVLVVTWDVACLRGVFGDLITLVQPPPYPGYDSKACPHPPPRNCAMLQHEAIRALADAVSTLASLTEIERDSRRLVARDWALTQTWQKSVHLLSDVVDSLCR